MARAAVLVTLALAGEVSPLDGCSVAYSVASGSLDVTLTVATTGWVGFGLAPSGSAMVGSDVVRVSGAGAVEDGHVRDTKTVLRDCQQDWNLVSRSVDNGVTTVSLSRALDTGDPQDHAVVDGRSVKLLCSYGADGDADFGYHGSRRGLVRADLFDRPPTFLGQPVPSLAELKATAGVSYVEIMQSARYADMHQSMEGDPSQPFPLPVPGNMGDVTTYVESCTDLPSDVVSNGAHLVAFEALPDPNMPRGVVHHYVLRLSKRPCAEHTYGRTELDIWPWAPGAGDFVFPANLGFPVGGSTGYVSVVNNVHYENPSHHEGLLDRSNVKIYYTFNLRAQELGVIDVADPMVDLIGQPTVPKGDSYGPLGWHRFYCPPGWLGSVLGEGESITVFASHLHMHRHGVSMETKVQDWKGATKFKSRTGFYDGNFQDRQDLSPVTVTKGDSVTTTCVMTSDKLYNKEGTVYGLAGDEEMCIDFLYYFPAKPALPKCNAAAMAAQGGAYLAQTTTAERVWGGDFGRPPAGLNAACDAAAPAAATEYVALEVTSTYATPSTSWTFTSTLSVATQGPANADHHFLALHGFPQGSWMWMPEFAPALREALGGSVRVLAPDLRGANRTVPKYDCPDLRCPAYDPAAITDEVAALLETHFADVLPIHVVGHDWGAAIAWMLAERYPQHVRTLTAMDVAHPRVFRLFLEADEQQQAASGYARYFADRPGDAFRGMLPSAEGWGESADLLLRVDDPAAYIDAWLHEDALRHHLNWYRGSDGFKTMGEGGPVSLPVLQLWGADDPYVLPRQICCLKYFTEQLHVRVFNNTGHWIVEQRPRELAALVAQLVRGELDMSPCGAVKSQCHEESEAVCHALGALTRPNPEACDAPAPTDRSGCYELGADGSPAVRIEDGDFNRVNGFTLGDAIWIAQLWAGKHTEPELRCYVGGTPQQRFGDFNGVNGFTLGDAIFVAQAWAGTARFPWSDGARRLQKAPEPATPLNAAESPAVRAVLRGLGVPEAELQGCGCASYGCVKCDQSGHVIELDLARAGLSGTIAAEVGALTELRRLELQGNTLRGSIPEALGSLTQLRFLYLAPGVGGAKQELQVSQVPSLRSLTELVELYVDGEFDASTEACVREFCTGSTFRMTGSCVGIDRASCEDASETCAYDCDLSACLAKCTGVEPKCDKTLETKCKKLERRFQKMKEKTKKQRKRKKARGKRYHRQCPGSKLGGCAKRRFAFSPDAVAFRPEEAQDPVADRWERGVSAADSALAAVTAGLLLVAASLVCLLARLLPAAAPERARATARLSEAERGTNLQ